MELKLLINRIDQGKKQSLGEIFVLNQNNEIQKKAVTLELPWLKNERRISCIPAGTYPVEKRISPKFGLHFHIKDVPGRSFILIHAGNYYTQILGCVLIGSDFSDINKDGLLDVVNSGKTLKEFLEIMPQSFQLEIR